MIWGKQLRSYQTLLKNESRKSGDYDVDGATTALLETTFDKFRL